MSCLYLFKPDRLEDMTLSNEKKPTVSPEDLKPEDLKISLLEEKLQVTRQRKKIGEVVIRKKVETRMVRVPIRREKLIVERIGENPELLTEVIIGESKLGGYEELNDSGNLNLTQSNFLSVSTAQELLEAISHLSTATNAKVRLEIISDDSMDKDELQNICDRYSH